MNNAFEYDFEFGKCNNMRLVITNKDDIANNKIKDGYIPYVDPSRNSFEKCFKNLNNHYYILVKIDY